jgi:hypothetical protein
MRPIARPEPAAPPPGISSNHPIDRFVNARIAEAHLSPAPQADRRTLIRRLSYDLTGMPPSADDVDAFLSDPSPSAFENLVERLLASPAYGERWGRHWLDVVRYADTCGNASDYPVPQLRLYRDWVIRAVNSDMPYDQFLKEQIAGDLISARSPEERRDRVIATGYLALARRFAGKAGAAHLTIEDTIDNLSKAFLGVTLACARCHDHKFDAFTTRDYYALYGFFSSTRYPYPGAEGDPKQSGLTPLIAPAAVEELLAPHKSLVAGTEADLKQWETQHKELAAKATEGDSKKQLEEITLRIAETKKKLAGLSSQEPVVPDAYAVTDAQDPADARIQNRGEPKNLGDSVRRGFPAVLGGQELDRNATGSGREALADWVASASNPLTARVMVNRIWLHHFGRGIVATPNDFGKQGTAPTHPELLDYLASEFIRSGWSLKAMHRLILSSDTWKRSCGEDPAPGETDPLNSLLARQNRRRLDAESLRDTLLHVSGDLLPGPAPEHPFPARHTWRWTQHNPFRESYDSRHRSVYLMQARLKKNDFLSLFDGPDPSASTGMRPLTTTPLQALFAMNHPLVHNAAANIAARTAGTPDQNNRITQIYRILFQRNPASSELANAGTFLDRYARVLRDSHSGDAPWAALSRSLICSNELLFLD